MKLAVSNIAWDSNENDEIASLLKDNNVTGIEVAPTKICPDLNKLSDEVIRDYLHYWKQREISIIAMQSLLFNQNHLSVFDESSHQMMVYLEKIIKVASQLSAKALVFGSPKNRLIGTLDPALAQEKALIFFNQLGDIAYSHGVYICIEANPKQYGCDFITNTMDGLDFVRQVDNKGIKLQIDTGTMLINEEVPLSIFEQCLPHIGHFHISEPFLDMVGKSNHAAIADSLRSLGYNGWLSIEMKNNLHSNNVAAISRALEYVRSVYF
ncbi:sugar phosphate isomerase/epimerase [Paenibacillus sp. tmac-D7]|uniref:sugar phosphate isomerase/epimerase family protein n=1 Tax=Paenibacillus sp. tmac-D7 TaxID=2591462 RepID=UPI001143DBB6|nr:sugar phosphate isomerase/epimerase family protein [Paenibacillus sp. tmac-D7]